MKKVIVLLLFLPALALADGLRVDEAVLSAGSYECNATGVIQQQCNGRMSCNVPVDSHLCAYKHGGTPILSVRYRCGSNRYRLEAPWGEQVSLYCESSAAPVQGGTPPPVHGNRGYGMQPPPVPVLEIRQARYGLPGHGWCDATWSVASQCANQVECRVRASNGWCGDPVPGEVKQMEISYRCGWNEQHVIIREKQSDILRCVAPGAPYGTGNPNGIQVIYAEYGHDNRRCNARPALAARCDGDYSCSFKVGNQWCGDPARHQVKDLLIRWRCGWEEQEARFAEHQWGEISCMQRMPRQERPHIPAAAPRHPALQIHSAYYGQFPKHICNATAAVSRQCTNKAVCKVKASNRLCGDPARGVKKTLTVEYGCNGARQKRSVAEGQRLKLACNH